jgi:hypothetical protein
MWCVRDAPSLIHGEHVGYVPVGSRPALYSRREFAQLCTAGGGRVVVAASSYPRPGEAS